MPEFIDIVISAPPIYIDFVSEAPPIYMDLVVPLISELSFTVLSDYDAPYYYTGIAYVGSDEDAAVWKIIRREVSEAGTIAETITVTGAKWSEHLTIEY